MKLSILRSKAKNISFKHLILKGQGFPSHSRASRTLCDKLRIISISLANIFGNALNRVTVSLIGRNLLTFTDYTGFDPEVGSTETNASTGGDVTLYRVDNFAYPNFRTFTGKLEIQF